MFAGVDMDRMGAEWRLHLDYDTLSLGGKSLPLFKLHGARAKSSHSRSTW